MPSFDHNKELHYIIRCELQCACEFQPHEFDSVVANYLFGYIFTLKAVKPSSLCAEIKVSRC